MRSQQWLAPLSSLPHLGQQQQQALLLWLQ
jgi:hypothetical protein